MTSSTDVVQFRPGRSETATGAYGSHLAQVDFLLHDLDSSFVRPETRECRYRVGHIASTAVRESELSGTGPYFFCLPATALPHLEDGSQVTAQRSLSTDPAVNITVVVTASVEY